MLSACWLWNWWVICLFLVSKSYRSIEAFYLRDKSYKVFSVILGQLGSRIISLIKKLLKVKGVIFPLLIYHKFKYSSFNARITVFIILIFLSLVLFLPILPSSWNTFMMALMVDGFKENSSDTFWNIIKGTYLRDYFSYVSLYMIWFRMSCEMFLYFLDLFVDRSRFFIIGRGIRLGFI